MTLKELNSTPAILKPCPFCGNKALKVRLMHPQYWETAQRDDWCYWDITCYECGTDMEYGRLKDQTWQEAKQALIDTWNTRVDLHEAEP